MSQAALVEEAGKQLEALYRIGDAVRRRCLGRAALGASPDERILDVGCGPGFYCAELVDEVGAGGEVVGLDGRRQMLELAARRCEGHDNEAPDGRRAPSLVGQGAGPLSHEESMFRVLLVVIAIAAVIVLVVLVARAV